MTDTAGFPRAHRFESARAARVAAVQALFQIEKTQALTQSIIQEFQEHRLPSEDYPYLPNGLLFSQLVTQVYENYADIHHLVSSNLPEDWVIEGVDPVLRLTLMVGCGELLYNKPDTLPAPVIISEYVDVARGFCGHKEAGFANRVLDQIAHHLHLPLTAPV